MQLPRNAKKYAIAIVVGFIAWQALSAVADQLSSNSATTSTPEISISETETPLQNVDTSSITVQSESPTAYPTGQVTYISGTESSVTDTPQFVSDQKVQLKVPASIPVDPRAATVSIPSIFIYSTGNLVTCLDISNANARINVENNSDTTTGTALITGNGGKHLLVSGSASQVMNALNSGSGIRLFANNVVNSSVLIKVVGVTTPTLDSQFCSQPSVSGQISVRAMGLDLNLQKNKVQLKSK